MHFNQVKMVGERKQIKGPVWCTKKASKFAPPPFRSIERVKRNSANPSDVLRLLKQPVGATRLAVRAADYMDNAVKLIRTSLLKRQKRSINATGAHAKSGPSDFPSVFFFTAN